MNTAKEIVKLRDTILVLGIITFFATHHWIAGVVGVIVAAMMWHGDVTGD